jgi:thymidylate kinase
VRASYLEVARAEPRRLRIVDASQSLEAVQVQVAAVLDELVKSGS